MKFYKIKGDLLVTTINFLGNAKLNNVTCNELVALINELKKCDEINEEKPDLKPGESVEEKSGSQDANKDEEVS